MSKRDSVLLSKILDEIVYAETAVANLTFDEFMSDETIKRATCMTLINIGELARFLSEETKAAAPNIPFNEIIATRNVAAHGYQTLRFEDVWSTLKSDLPRLREEMEKLADVFR